MNLPEAIQAASIALQALDDRISAMERRQAEIDAAFAKLAPVKPHARYYDCGCHVRKIEGDRVYVRDRETGSSTWHEDHRSPEYIAHVWGGREITESEGEI